MYLEKQNLGQKFGQKYINPTCWLKLLSILKRGFCCCLFNVYPFVFDPAFLINLYASFFWFGTIFSEEESWLFYFNCVFCFMFVVFVFKLLFGVL